MCPRVRVGREQERRTNGRDYQKGNVANLAMQVDPKFQSEVQSLLLIVPLLLRSYFSVWIPTNPTRPRSSSPCTVFLFCPRPPRPGESCQGTRTLSRQVFYIPLKFRFSSCQAKSRGCHGFLGIQFASFLATFSSSSSASTSANVLSCFECGGIAHPATSAAIKSASVLMPRLLAEMEADLDQGRNSKILVQI